MLETFLIVFAVLFLLALLAFIYASQIEVRRYSLETLPVAIQSKEKLHLKILHISDLHLAKPESHKIDFLQQITNDDYDLVILTGDVFENESGIPYAAKILAKKPRLGAYAVLGNHDYYNYTMFHKTVGRIWRKYRHPQQMRDVTPMIKALQEGGFTVMRNEALTLKEMPVHIVGIDYPSIEYNKLKDLVSLAPSGYLVISLLHVPHKLDDLPKSGVDLTFAGHTHGGQVRMPYFGAIVTDSELARHEASGLTQRGKTSIHVSRGLGADPKTNFRFFCPPAATVINVTAIDF